jgi:hypothetical protein
MSGRNLDTNTAGALDAYGQLFPAFFMRLDIQGDPVLIWTGIGPATLTGTGDAAIEGFTFDGVANMAYISDVVDTDQGSQVVTLALQGVNLSDPALRQVVANASRWQYRKAWLWLVLFTSAGAMIGKPIRLKTGRMDQMNPSDPDDNGEGIVTASIESQQAYAGEALNTRYSEQKTDVDSTDTSQDYVWDLANRQPDIGQKPLTGIGGMIQQVAYDSKVT